MNIDEIVSVWKTYADSLTNWEELVVGVESKQTICGPIYEPASPLNERAETFAVSDMRQVKIAHPHYHANGETEIYFVLQGSGLTVMGGREIPLEKGVFVVTPPETAHFTLPKENLVLMVINAPSFNPANNIEIDETDPKVKFDKTQYDRLTASIQE